MPEGSTVFLMYHELELPGRALCRTEPGYVRYILHASDFEAQMQALQGPGGAGSASVLHCNFLLREVAITFDDGSETDLLTAAPQLQRLGFGATFYVTAGFVGNRGYLSPLQLRELSNAGFEIGCHSMTHAYLTDLDASRLQHEIVAPKLKLEQVIGKTVEHFSCPGGRWNQAAIVVAREAGYRSVANSEIHPNSAATDRFALGRVAITRQTNLAEFISISKGGGLWQQSAASALRNSFKKLLGNRLYDRVREAVLGGNRK